MGVHLFHDGIHKTKRCRLRCDECETLHRVERADGYSRTYNALVELADADGWTHDTSGNVIRDLCPKCGAAAKARP